MHFTYSFAVGSWVPCLDCKELCHQSPGLSLEQQHCIQSVACASRGLHGNSKPCDVLREACK